MLMLSKNIMTTYVTRG